MLFETVYKGDMYYVDPDGSVTGSEQKSGRPAVIVSNNIGNSHSPIVEVVYLTTQPKNDLPTHVVIRSAPRVSTALCEQIMTVSKERLSSFIGNISKTEQDNIDRALEISLGLTPPRRKRDGARYIIVVRRTYEGRGQRERSRCA